MSTELDNEAVDVLVAAEPAIDQQLQIPEELPVLPLRDIVIYPFMIVPLFVSREKSISAVDEALNENRMILLVCAEGPGQGRPDAGRSLRRRHGRHHHAHAEAARRPHSHSGPGLSRAKVESVDTSGDYLRARLSVLIRSAGARTLARSRSTHPQRARVDGKGRSLGKNISPEVMAIIANLDDAGRLADLSASNLELKVEDAQSVLDIADTTARLRRVNELLNKEIEVLTVQQEINTQARADIDRSQREFFLRQQMKAIQSELGEGNELAEEIAAVPRKDSKPKMPKQAEEEALRQLKKLERMHPDAAETATLRNWLDIMTDLPWSKSSKDNLDLLKGRAHSRRGSLRSRQGEGAHHRSARRAQAEGKTKGADPLSRRPAGRRQNVAWAFGRARARPQVRAA